MMCDSVYVVLGCFDYEGGYTIAAFTCREDMACWLAGLDEGRPLGCDYLEVSHVPIGAKPQEYCPIKCIPMEELCG